MFFYQEENSMIPYNYDVRNYSDTSIPAHMHLDYEWIWVKRGTVEIMVEGRPGFLYPGDSALILSNQIHEARIPEQGEVWICVFSRDYVPEFARIMKDRSCQNSHMRLDPLEEQLIREKLIEGNAGRLDRCACLMMICCAFMKSRKETEFQNVQYTHSEVLLHRMLSYVAQHYRENITLKSMADCLGYEEHYMSRAFSNCFQMNFKQLVNEYRIQYARQLLGDQSEKRTMTEIAYLSGFQSVRNFNRAYQRIAGTQPRREKV